MQMWTFSDIRLNKVSLITWLPTLENHRIYCKIKLDVTWNRLVAKSHKHQDFLFQAYISA